MTTNNRNKIVKSVTLEYESFLTESVCLKFLLNKIKGYEHLKLPYKLEWLRTTEIKMVCNTGIRVMCIDETAVQADEADGNVFSKLLHDEEATWG